MRYFKIIILGFVLFSCNNQNPSKKDEAQIKNLIIQVLEWGDSKNSIGLLPVVTDSKDSVYIGFDLAAHRKNLELLKQTNFFTDEFIENYNQIILTLDKGLRNGEYDTWLVGDLPTFIFANDYSPWWNGQETFTLEQGTIELISSDKNSCEYYFKCGNKENECEGMENYKMRFKVSKESNKWKISYLEGFEFKESTRKDGVL
ncbi:MAG TPA: hypothetical protein VK179_14190 [Bacteroidales bacterium]|nr:hypothetical protein [Bacteroidales bacterium]